MKFEEGVILKRILWLGHTSRMIDYQQKDHFTAGKIDYTDLKEINMQTDWYEIAQDRKT